MASHYNTTIPLNKAQAQPFPLPVYEREFEQQKLQNLAYASYVGLITCLSWNLFAVTCLWILEGSDYITLILAIALLFLGAPTAYATWYRNLSLAFREEEGENGSKLYQVFLVYYFLQIAFCFYASMNFHGRYITGISTAVDVYLDNNNLMIGIFYLIGSVLFYLELLLSFWVLIRVKAYYSRRQVGLSSVGI